MRHTKVTQTPAQAGRNVLPIGEQAEISCRGVFQIRSAVPALDEAEGKDGGYQQRAQHQQALEKVRPAHGGEAAHEGVGDDDHRRDVHGHRRVNAHHGVKQRAAGLDAAGGIHRIRYQKNDSADHLHGFAAGQEAVGQILGDGDGVLGGNGIPAQPRRFKDPAQGIADRQTNGNPRFPHAKGVHRRGQTHQHPGAHVRRAGRQSRYPGTHFSAAQEIILFIGVFAAEQEINTDADGEDQIEDKNDQFSIHKWFRSFPALALKCRIFFCLVILYTKSPFVKSKRAVFCINIVFSYFFSISAFRSNFQNDIEISFRVLYHTDGRWRSCGRTHWAAGRKRKTR